MSIDLDGTPAHDGDRTLPNAISIPVIHGEMLTLRPAVEEDADLMDAIDAYATAEVITGKSPAAERAAARSWLARSIAWGDGREETDDYADPELRSVMAWAMMGGVSEHAIAKSKDLAAQTTAVEGTPDRSSDALTPAEGGEGGVFLGMIFLVDIDGWNRSARVQAILGPKFRGRGYQRDAIPRIMTYAFAPRPVGLGLERVWMTLPDENTRNSGVYESLGFDLVGRSRNAIWNAHDRQYHDMLVYDEIAEEYDPIQSLAAFGLRNIPENPGVKEALAARERLAAEAPGPAPQDGAEAPASPSEQPAHDEAQAAAASWHTEWAYGDDAAGTPAKKRAWWRFGGSRSGGKRKDKDGKAKAKDDKAGEADGGTAGPDKDKGGQQ